jgi:DNA-binding GntR family transcriptional regulator
MARAGSGGTRADTIFLRLRGDILRGRLSPGAKLSFPELQRRYEASTGVLREVLPRLVEQGLATTEPQLGYHVVTVSIEDLRELTEARVALESTVARMAAENGDVDYEAGVLAAHHALARTPTADPDDAVSEEWITRHESFHLAVLQGCGNAYLLGAVERLRTVSAVYRYWTAEETERVHRDLAGEHRAISDAAVDRDGERLAALLSQHIRTTSELLMATHGTPPTAEPRQ